jgi:BASS family bile acid:Na+ symporter
VLQVFAIVLVSVLIGMVVRSRASAFAAQMDRPVRILSIAVLVMVILGTMVAERENIATYIADAGLVALAFCVASLSVGYVVPRMFNVSQRQSVACAMEIGIHNGTLAIAIAISVLGSVSLAVPAAVYSLAMYPCATIAGLLITRAGCRVREVEAL